VDTDKERSAPGKQKWTLSWGDVSMSYLGVDLHTNSFTVCRRTKQDKESIRTFQIARIADFRKTLRKRTLKNGWVFEDFPNFVLVSS